VQVAGGSGAVDESGGAVLAQAELVGDMAHPGRWACVDVYGEQQVVLGVGEPESAGPFLALALEQSEGCPGDGQAPVVRRRLWAGVLGSHRRVSCCSSNGKLPVTFVCIVVRPTRGRLILTASDCFRT